MARTKNRSANGKKGKSHCHKRTSRTKWSPSNHGAKRGKSQMVATSH